MGWRRGVFGKGKKKIVLPNNDGDECLNRVEVEARLT